MKKTLNNQSQFYKKYGKRVFDFIISFMALILLSPILVIISILVLVFMGWPIFFKQPRPGKDEKIFNMYKFRTMSSKKGADGKLLPDTQRLNSFGKILRRTSLDELPELLCILVGKMSIVGPRPLLVEYLPYYTKEERLRHTVRPGLTGYAQVNGRNNSPWSQRLQNDIYYVKNMSFFMDLKIFLKTIKKVFLKEDITACPSSDLSFGKFDDERRKNDIKKR